MILLIYGIEKLIQTNVYEKQKQAHRYRKQTSGFQRGDGRWGTNQGHGINTYKILCIKQISNKNTYTLQQRELQPLSCNNLQWSIICKKTKSLCGSDSLIIKPCPPRDLMDCSPPGSSAHGISQARVLVWVAISFSGIFPSQRSNLGLPRCRQILHQLSHRAACIHLKLT